MDFEIKQYDASHRKAVWDLNDRALSALGPRPQGKLIEMLDQELRDIEGAYLRDGGEFLVGLVADRVVAMVALKRLNGHAAEITKMRVDPACWRRGYGQAMLHGLESRAVELGIRELWLDTSPRQVAAQLLYLKNGYEEYCRCLLCDTNMTLILFRKFLAGEAKGRMADAGA